MSVKEQLQLKRHYTQEGVHPYDMIEWDVRDAKIQNYRTGEVAFEQKDVEVPKSWSQNATNIVAQKYFRGKMGSPERETSVRQVIDRLVNRYHEEGLAHGYFAGEEEAQIFKDELTFLLVTQRAAFNSPVWFNVGFRPKGQEQVSACYILEVGDSMESIKEWVTTEADIFRLGSGAGVNVSGIRESGAPLTRGGTGSGPLSFMRWADSGAGSIKSGGGTRRAAKMVVMNVWHPEIRDFIWCKALEERKARVLRDAGYDMDLDGKDAHSMQYQNANNSVRVTDEFMQAAENGGKWQLRSVVSGDVYEEVDAAKLLREIAEAAWESADPGMQYDTTINDWHTCPESGRINGSNPCSEYMHVDNSSCNLASLNLLKFVDEGDVFDLDSYLHAVEIMFLAQEISISFGSFPTEKIGRNTLDMRQLGQGYANLGALLMSQGLAYDSDEGRAWASALMAIMTGHCYATSAKIAQRVGPYKEFKKNREAHLRVMRKHRAAVEDHVPGTEGSAGLLGNFMPLSLRQSAREVWDTAIALGEEHGYRNAQATVLAPTGTIGLLMDCDTTGIEPDLALKKMKKLVGGGTMSIVNHTVPRALRKLGYTDEQIKDIVEYIDQNSHVVGAPHLREEHLSVFDTAMGERAIHYMGHLNMMAATQPFISGAISKTVNLPESVTVEDVEQVYIEGWKRGLKAVALYRDNCKVAQPLAVAKSAQQTLGKIEQRAEELGDEGLQRDLDELEQALRTPYRERLPKRRRSMTTSFNVAGMEGYMIVGEYADGRPGEIFIKLAKQGSTLAGSFDTLSISLSMNLQYGVPLKVLVGKFKDMKFEPAGMVMGDEDIKMASSISDYIFRRLALDYLSPEDCAALNISSVTDRVKEVEEKFSSAVAEAGEEEPIGQDMQIEAPTHVPTDADHVKVSLLDAPYCNTCGIQMQPAGSCFACTSCGSTSGCS